MYNALNTAGCNEKWSLIVSLWHILSLIISENTLGNCVYSYCFKCWLIIHLLWIILYLLNHSLAHCIGV